LISLFFSMASQAGIQLNYQDNKGRAMTYHLTPANLRMDVIGGPSNDNLSILYDGADLTIVDHAKKQASVVTKEMMDQFAKLQSLPLAPDIQAQMKEAMKNA